MAGDVRRVAVVGAGIMGLSTAVCVTEALGADRVEVTVIAENYTPNTTSDQALGIWEPYLVEDDPQHRVSGWGKKTFDHMVELTQSEHGPNAGTFLVSGYSIFHSKVDDPSWSDAVIGFRHMTDKELGQYPGHRHGWAYTTAITECKFYLPWMLERFKQAGGQCIQKSINSLTELEGYDVVVNCTGIAAKEICHDTSIVPIKGQIHRVHAPWVKHFLNADDEDLYILPGADSVVLGGTHDVGQWDRTVCPSTKRRILRGCAQLIPSLSNVTVLKDFAGPRPGRSSVRLETEIIQANKPVKVVHNYGHGGSGITLHWGCALEATRLVKEALSVVI